MYQQFASFYDNDSRERFSLACAALALEHFELAGVSLGASVLDLACGTGRLVQELHQRGYQVSGIDLSERMLELARGRDYGKGACPRLIRGDVCNLPLDGPYHALLCFGDVINHLTDPFDLKRMFQEVFRVLAPGGLFLGDGNSLETFRSRLWNSAVPPTPWRDGRVSVRSMFDEQDGLGHMEAVFTGPGRPPVMERLAERFYEEQQVVDLLTEIGFEEVSSWPFHPLDLAASVPEVSVLKTVWTARKPD